MAIALNDPNISETMDSVQESDGTPISVLRLARVKPWDQRIAEARDRLNSFQPDWVSFQFVPFGYHRKGLCAGLGRKLAAINSKTVWHVMFHELWLGLDEKTPLKYRVLGAMQRTFIRDMIRNLRPRVVQTQAEPYRQVLTREKIPASVLPLISNVPYVKGDGWTGLLGPLLAAGQQMDRTKLYAAGIFGSVHPEWSAEEAVKVLLPLVQKSGKRLVLVFLGRNNFAPGALGELKSKLRDRADVVAAGERSIEEISKILQSLDLGLATSPRQAIQKSGSVAAMLEHGLPVLVTRDDWRLRGIELQSRDMPSRLLTPKEFALLDTLPAREVQATGNGRLKWIAGQMLGALQASQAN
jgi:hypothetical protein